MSLQYRLDRCKDLSSTQESTGCRKVVMGDYREFIIMNMKCVSSDAVLRLGTMLETVIPRILAFSVLKKA